MAARLLAMRALCCRHGVGLFLEAKINANLTMKVVATNLLDQLYYDSFYQSAAPFVLVAPGRSVSLVADAKF